MKLITKVLVMVAIVANISSTSAEPVQKPSGIGVTLEQAGDSVRIDRVNPGNRAQVSFRSPFFARIPV